MLHTMNRKVIPLVIGWAMILLGHPSLEAAEPEVVREESVDVPAWSMQVIQRHHGPPNSDAILIDVFLAEQGKRRLLAKNIIGPIVLFENKRRILSCESQGDVMAGRGPIVFDLSGQQTQVAQHQGYLRGCARIERSNLLLLHYNLMADRKPYNLVRVLSAEGTVVFEKKLIEQSEITVSEGGRTYRVRIPAPELPG